MTSNRHFEEVAETAALYALGKLPADERAGFEQRLTSGCSLCRAEVDSHQRIAEVLSIMVEATPPPSLEDRLMRRIGSGVAEDPKAKEPEILRAGEGEWVASTDPRTRFRFLHGRRTLLVRMDAGGHYPTHEHRFDEHCLVLEGTVEDGSGTKLGVGDFLFMPAGSKHTPSYSDSGCLLLIAYT